MNTPRKAVRPKAHATPRINTLYRLVASAYTRGLYHIFYEVFPFDLRDTAKRYVGHLTSEDLLQWKDESIAVYPTRAEDADGAREGSVCLDESGDMMLFYVGQHFRETPEDNLNVPTDPSAVDASIMMIQSRRIESRDVFDNIADKRVILSTRQITEAGLGSYTIHDPEVYDDTKHRYLTFLAVGHQGENIVVFAKEEQGNFKIKKLLPLEGEARIETLRFFSLDKHTFALMESSRQQGPETSIIPASINLEKGTIKLDLARARAIDRGCDASSPKLAWDTRRLPYLLSALQMHHDIKGIRGMVSTPKRISLDDDGLPLLSLHPLLARRLIYPEAEVKIKQTHYPQLLSATLEEGSFIAVGSTDIYFHEGHLFANRKKSMPQGEDRLPVASIDVSEKTCEVQVLIDQDCLEIFAAGQAVSFIVVDSVPLIRANEGVKNLCVYTLNRFKS